MEALTQPDVFRQRLRGRLIGISDRVLDAHLDLYGRYLAESDAIEREYRRIDWTKPTAAAPGLATSELYAMRIADLKLTIDGRMRDEVEELKEALEQHGITFVPNFYLGDADFWTTDRATSINVPWMLANDTLWEAVNERTTRFTVADVHQILRHETGHAINYAFRLYEQPDWRMLFGNFEAPYRDLFASDPTSRDYVQYLDRAGMKHYAQKHADEDFAETFATWLEGGWQEKYAGWPGALRKLGYVDVLAAAGAFSGEPRVTDLGERVPYVTLMATVGDYVGLESTGWSPHSALLRREPEVLNAATLHAAYFGNLVGGGMPAGQDFLSAVRSAFGSWESYMLDLRAIGGSVGNGWGVTVWDPDRKIVRNSLVDGHNTGLPAGCLILMAMDVFEHAVSMDGPKHIGLGAFFHNVNWHEVTRRFLVSQQMVFNPRPQP